MRICVGERTPRPTNIFHPSRRKGVKQYINREAYIFRYNVTMKIIRILFLFTLLSQLLFSATPEQIEQYLQVSSSEEQLITLESQFSQMQQNLNRSSTSAEGASNEYDMQLLSIRFREYIQKNLSEDEMNEVLKQYRNVVLLKFVSVQNDTEYDEKLAQVYMKELETEDNASVRLDLLDKISNTLYNEENVAVLFDNLMKPLLQNSMNGQKISDASLKKNKDAYIKRNIADGKLETAYMTREFTLEEVETLLDIVKTPAIERESKVIFGATAYALQEFFLSLASRYDPSKHKR